MASLKEIKGRIVSVQTTRKITLARQMVASAHLHHAQGALVKAHNYLDGLLSIAQRLKLQPEDDAPLMENHISKRTAVIVMSSNSGMCGSFNSKMERAAMSCAKSFPDNDFIFYPIGAKVRGTLENACLPVAGNFDILADKPSWGDITKFAADILTDFDSGKFSRVEIIYAKFRTVARQEVTREVLFPLEFGIGDMDSACYIMEPSWNEFTAQLIPMLVYARLYAALVSSAASEHAARMLAMQAATDNADDLLEELQLSYNKLRQQNITSELLDIIGGSFA